MQPPPKMKAKLDLSKASATATEDDRSPAKKSKTPTPASEKRAKAKELLRIKIAALEQVHTEEITKRDDSIHALEKQLQDQRVSYETRIAAVECENKARTQESLHSAERIRTLEEENKKLSCSNKDLVERINGFRKEEYVKAKEHEIAMLTKELESMQAELLRARKKYQAGFSKKDSALALAMTQKMECGFEIREKDMKIAMMGKDLVRLEEQKGELRNTIERLTAEMVVLRHREQDEFDAILQSFKVQSQRADYTETNRAMQKFSKHLEGDITPEEQKTSRDLKCTIADDLLKENQIEMSFAESHEFGLYLINEAIGQGINVVLSNSAADLKHDASMQFLASGAYNNYFYRLNFDINTDFFQHISGADLAEFVQEKVAAYLGCDKSDVEVLDSNHAEGYMSFQPRFKTGDMDCKLKSAEFQEYMRKETKDALRGLQLKPFLSTLMLTVDQIDDQYSQVFTETGKCMRGGMYYYLPAGWTGIGLKAQGKYDNGDNTWLGSAKQQPPEWAVGFHGLRNPMAAKDIVKAGLMCNGLGQAYSNVPDIRTGRPCGFGSYLTQHIEVAECFCQETRLMMRGGEKKFYVAMQCRVNPYEVKIPKKDSDLMEHKGEADWQNDYWIINSANDARPYRILFKEVTPKLYI